MADESAAGKVGKPFEMHVELGKVREFTRAVRADHPALMDGLTPPTFLTTTFFWEGDANPWPEVKLDPKRGMHAEQEYVFHGPPPKAGDELTCISRIEKVFTKEGRRGGKLTFAVMVTEFRDPSGRLVAEARMTGVETERAP
jgi:hypothetical protein